MSPSMILQLQRCLGENFDSKVFSWKKEIEEKQSDVDEMRLLTEIAEKQLPKLQSDDMDLDVALDLRKEALQEYTAYNPNIWCRLLPIMEAEKNKRGLTEYTDEILRYILEKYQGLDIPYFK